MRSDLLTALNVFVFWGIVRCSYALYILIMEAVVSSETLVDCLFTLRHFFFFVALQPNEGYDLLIHEVFLDYTQRRTTVCMTPLDEWSARRRDLYLTTYNTHNRQTSMPPVGFEPTISAGERPQTYVLDRAATGTGTLRHIQDHNLDSQYTMYPRNTN